jgi:hypothetical protein
MFVVKSRLESHYRTSDVLGLYFSDYRVYQELSQTYHILGKYCSHFYGVQYRRHLGGAALRRGEKLPHGWRCGGVSGHQEERVGKFIQTPRAGSR